MTKRDRIDKVFNRELPDRIPVYDKLRNDTAIEYYAGRKLTQKNKFEVVTKAIEKTIDMTVAVRLPHAEEIIIDKKGFVWQYHEWNERIKERPFTDLKGAAQFIKDEIQELTEGGFKEEPFIDLKGAAWTGRLGQNYQKSVLAKNLNLQKTTGGTVIALDSEPGLNTAYSLIGLENFIYLYADDAPLISDWLEALCRNELKRIKLLGTSKKLSPAVPYTQVYSDIASNIGLVFSPHFLEREFFPRLKEVVKMWNKYGCRCYFHSDGNLTPVIPDLIDCGIVGLHPLETHAGMDLLTIKKKFGRKLVLIGGIDCSVTLPWSTPEQVREEVKNTIEIAGEDGGYIIGSTSELHRTIPLENVIAMFEAARDYGVYT